MTDNEIIKALECCSTGETYADCEKNGCPLYLGITMGCKYIDKENQLYSDALGIINRQQSEIERLKSMNQAKLDCIHDLQKENEILSRNADTAFQDDLNERRDLFAPEIKAETIKEFTERLKNKIKTECNPYGKPTFDYDTSLAIMRYIDNLLKEMVGETE